MMRNSSASSPLRGVMRSSEWLMRSRCSVSESRWSRNRALSSTPATWDTGKMRCAVEALGFGCRPDVPHPDRQQTVCSQVDGRAQGLRQPDLPVAVEGVAQSDGWKENWDGGG